MTKKLKQKKRSNKKNDIGFVSFFRLFLVLFYVNWYLLYAFIFLVYFADFSLF